MTTQLDKTNCTLCIQCKAMIKIEGVWQQIAVPSIARIADERCNHGTCPDCERRIINEKRFNIS
jgi:hypothetical protein